MKEIGRRNSQLVFLRWWRRLFGGLIALFLLCGSVEVLRERSDRRYVDQLAWGIVNSAHASDNTARVVALRDYLLTHVTFHGFSDKNRPFFRDSAADTLQSGKGFCGEVTRAFINMAEATGIPAQRVNLWGPSPHVVAEAELSPGNRILVDAQNPPTIRGLLRLDQVMTTGKFTDYYTLNLRRLHVTWLVSRVQIELRPVNYLTEHPHALKALLWFILGFVLVAASLASKLIRFCLRRAGWVQISDLLASTQPGPASFEGATQARETASAAILSGRT